MYVLHSGNLTPRMELDHGGPITDCAFSPDNQYLAVADANRLVTLYRLPGFEVISHNIFRREISFEFFKMTMQRCNSTLLLRQSALRMRLQTFIAVKINCPFIHGSHSIDFFVMVEHEVHSITLSP